MEGTLNTRRLVRMYNRARRDFLRPSDPAKVAAVREHARTAGERAEASRQAILARKREKYRPAKDPLPKLNPATIARIPKWGAIGHGGRYEAILVCASALHEAGVHPVNPAVAAAMGTTPDKVRSYISTLTRRGQWPYCDPGKEREKAMRGEGGE